MNEEIKYFTREIQKQAEALDNLQIFTGNWKTEGYTNSGLSIQSIDKYSWLNKRYFLIHTWESHLENDYVEGIEIIGYDNGLKKYFTQAFDSKGNNTKYTAELSNTNWRINGDTERFNGEFSANGNILSGEWEYLQDGKWVSWMQIVLTKMI